MADSRETSLESLPVDPALLESANRWFDISWYGLVIAGIYGTGGVRNVVFHLRPILVQWRKGAPGGTAYGVWLRWGLVNVSTFTAVVTKQG
jgi:hypothetical protein